VSRTADAGLGGIGFAATITVGAGGFRVIASGGGKAIPVIGGRRAAAAGKRGATLSRRHRRLVVDIEVLIGSGRR